MELKEVSQMLAVIKEVYPNYIKDNANIPVMAKMWHTILGEYSLDIAMTGLNSYMAKDTKGFAPVPGQLLAEIRKLTSQIENKPKTTTAQAWDMVVEVLRGALCYHNPAEAFKKLPLAIQKCVGSARTLQRWSMTDSDQLHNFIRSQFMRDYKDMASFYEEQEALPYSVKLVIGQYQESKTPRSISFDNGKVNYGFPDGYGILLDEDW